MILKSALENMRAQAGIMRKCEVNLQLTAQYAFNQYRERTGDTTTALAVKLAVTTKYVENVEAGLLMPSEAVIEKLLKLADAGGINV